MVLGGMALFYERGTPVGMTTHAQSGALSACESVMHPTCARALKAPKAWGALSFPLALSLSLSIYIYMYII